MIISYRHFPRSGRQKSRPIPEWVNTRKATCNLNAEEIFLIIEQRRWTSLNSSADDTLSPVRNKSFTYICITDKHWFKHAQHRSCELMVSKIHETLTSINPTLQAFRPRKTTILKIMNKATSKLLLDTELTHLTVPWLRAGDRSFNLWFYFLRPLISLISSLSLKSQGYRR